MWLMVAFRMKKNVYKNACWLGEADEIPGTVLFPAYLELKLISLTSFHVSVAADFSLFSFPSPRLNLPRLKHKVKNNHVK